MLQDGKSSKSPANSHLSLEDIAGLLVGMKGVLSGSHSDVSIQDPGVSYSRSSSWCNRGSIFNHSSVRIRCHVHAHICYLLDRPYMQFPIPWPLPKQTPSSPYYAGNCSVYFPPHHLNTFLRAWLLKGDISRWYHSRRTCKPSSPRQQVSMVETPPHFRVVV